MKPNETALALKLPLIQISATRKPRREPIAVLYNGGIKRSLGLRRTSKIAWPRRGDDPGRVARAGMEAAFLKEPKRGVAVARRKRVTIKGKAPIERQNYSARIYGASELGENEVTKRTLGRGKMVHMYTDLWQPEDADI